MNLERVIAVRNNKTVYRDGEYAIKVFDSDFSKAQVLSEALNQAMVEETGLDIPKIIEVTTVEGKWAIVSEFIKGKTLARLMQEFPEKKEEYLAQLVWLQMRVHARTVPGLTKLKDKMHQKICDANLDATVRYDLHTRLEGMPKHTKLCHGDFNPSNIIISEEGRPFILDWSHVTQGNASADVARSYLLFRLSGDDAAAEFYLDLFCAKSGTDKRYVQEWMPIVAASQSVKGKPEERELLLRWATVANYE